MTGEPSRIFCRPDTISCSPTCKPLCNTYSLPMISPSCTGFSFATMPWSFFSATNAKNCALMRVTAVTGIVRPGAVDQTTRARTN